MTRKLFPSDKLTTTIRVRRQLHREIRKAALKDGRTIEEFMDRLIMDGLARAMAPQNPV